MIGKIAFVAALSGPLLARGSSVVFDEFEMTVYDAPEECDAQDDTQYRVYSSIQSGVCQPVGTPASTDDHTNACREFYNGGMDYQDCSDEIWSAHSIFARYTSDVDYCRIYTSEDCSGEALGFNLEENLDGTVGTCQSFDGISSFLCGLKNETATEPTEVGDENNPGWRDISCDAGSLTDNANDPETQWNDAGTNEAWKDFVSQWQNHNSTDDPDLMNLPNDGDQSLTDFMANYFHGAPAPNCGEIDPNCDDTTRCGQADDGQAPAGYIILNSIYNLHRQYDNFWNGLEAAQGDLTNNYKAFSDAFNPILATVKEQKQALDALNLMWGFLSAGLFNSFFKKVPFAAANSNALGIAKDSSNALVAFGINWSKDGMSTSAQTAIRDDVENYMMTMIDGMQSAIETTVTNLFTPETDWTPLYDAISSGKTFSGTSVVDGVSDITGDTTKLIYANTLSYMWRAQDVGRAWIMTSDGMPTDDTKTGCDRFLPSEGYGENADWFISPDNDAVSRFCDGDTAYWIVWADVDPSICSRSTKRTTRHHKRIGPNDPIQTCNDEDKVVTGQAFGIEKLNGEDFGGLTHETVGLNAVYAWIANGNANGWAVPDLTNVDDIAAFGDEPTIENVRGLVNIPVCSKEQMRDATEDDVWNTNDNANWPCPA